MRYNETPVIPQANPRANYLAYKEEIDAAMMRAASGGQYIRGPELEAFEREFGDYLGGCEVIGTGSGTEAIHLALRAAGIGPGDAVLTVSHTAGATVSAIELAGARPLLVDIDPDAFTIATNALEDAISRFRSDVPEKLKAIMPVHLYGLPARIEKLKEIAERNGLLLIEDCAQSHGASVKGEKTGTFGDLAAFSFYPTKNLSAMGDGGAVVTANAAFAEKARMIREYGWKERYVSDIPGMNTRLDELQAAVLRVKLKHLNEGNDKRKAIASRYNQLLSSTSIVSPKIPYDQEANHVFHQFVIRTEKRDQLRDFLAKNGIQTSIHYPLPVHLQPAYKNRVMLNGSLEVTEKICREILSLPVYPELTMEEVDQIGETIVRWWNEPGP